MFSELVDVLRCLRPHEESWLVLAARKVENRDILEGVLGCPVCHAEYPIIEGVARFGSAPNDRRWTVPSEEEALRLVALLDLTGARGYAVIIGGLTRHSSRMRELTDVQLLLVNPAPDTPIGGGISSMTIQSSWTKLPLAPLSARALALDDGATPAQLESAIEIVAARGRILAPVALPMPEGLTELARDDRQWLAERAQVTRSPGVVTLQRRR